MKVVYNLMDGLFPFAAMGSALEIGIVSIVIARLFTSSGLVRLCAARGELWLCCQARGCGFDSQLWWLHFNGVGMQKTLVHL